MERMNLSEVKANQCILSPFLFPPLHWFAELASFSDTIFIANRVSNSHKFIGNRMLLPGPNSLTYFSIPIHQKSLKEGVDSIRFVREQKWKRECMHALQTVYGKTPYFEHYEPHLSQIILNASDVYLDLFNSLMQWYNSSLQWEVKLEFCNALATFELDQSTSFLPYNQAFDSIFGFVPHVSILDLLFSKGPEAGLYLENILVKNAGQKR